MAKAKKQTAPGTKRGRPAKVNASDLFKIEEKPPVYLRGNTPEKQKAMQMLEKTVDHTKPGQAFILPAVWKNQAAAWLRDNRPDEVFRFTSVMDNEEVLRVYKFLRS